LAEVGFTQASYRATATVFLCAAILARAKQRAGSAAKRAAVFPRDLEAKESGFKIAQSRQRRGAAILARAKATRGQRRRSEPASSLPIMKAGRAPAFMIAQSRHRRGAAMLARAKQRAAAPQSEL
jgi:hypothetical protein